MLLHGTRKALYVNADTTDVVADGNRLRILRAGEAERSLPLRDLGRAVVEGASEDLLAACLAIVRSGGTVHFADGGGRLVAVLHATSGDRPDWVDELAWMIERHPGGREFDWWQDAQKRHAWSLVFRRGPRGLFEHNRRRLLRYLSHYRPDAAAAAEIEYLETQARAWLEAELYRAGMQPVLSALGAIGRDLVAALHQCLSVPLLWHYVRWRREVASIPGEQDLVRFLELQAVGALRNQLERHLHALVVEYHAALHAHDDAEHGGAR